MKPLQDLVVLDLTRVLAGPYAGMMLADMGADVIKVEARGHGDDSRAFGPYVNGESCYFMSLNRGKKSITLDLKKPEGKEIIKNLVKKADILLENFRGGTMKKLGLDYDVLKEINPRLIYVATTGFGLTGPYAHDPAYDVIVQGMGGLMSITGQEGGEPTRVGASVGDITAGLFSVIGLLTALHAREKTGKGQLVDVGMLDCQVAILENAISRYLNADILPQPIGNRHPSITPFESFKSKDGYVIIAVGNDNLWAKFCELIGKPEWVEKEEYKSNSSRTANQPALKADLTPIFAEKTTKEWIIELKAIGVPVGPINTVADVIEDPSIQARDMIVTVDHPVAGPIQMPGLPIKLSDTPGEVNIPAPVLGADNDEILSTMLGMSADEIAELKEKEVI